MNRDMEKGFTLIELLAVIVVLAVIALIATPMIMNIITSSRENTIKTRAQSYAYAAEAAILNLQAEGEDLSNGTINTSKLDNYIKYDGPKVDGFVTLKNGAVIGYDLYINGYRVKKDGEEVTVELYDGKVQNIVSDIYVIRDGEEVHITDSSELQDGDVYINGQYEYHYNASVELRGDDIGSWNIDNTLNGWSMRLTDTALSDFEINTQMVTEIAEKNVVCMSALFAGSRARVINMESFDTSNVTNMIMMFAYCSNLEIVNFGEGFNTSNVTDMSGMFEDCSSLTSLDLSRFNTSKVTNMREMFWACSSLTSLDLSGFNTSKVTDMSYMFAECLSLEIINLSGWNTSNVTNMGWMFKRCESITSLDLSSFSTASVTDMREMFMECSSLSNLNLSSDFVINEGVDHSSMFCDTSLDFSTLDLVVDEYGKSCPIYE